MSTTKQFEKYMEVMARHVGQNLVDEVKRKPETGKGANPNMYVLSKSTKDRSSMFKVSTRKPSDYSRVTGTPVMFLTTMVGSLNFETYKAYPKIYFAPFNLYGRAIDIAEYLAKTFIGSYSNIEQYHVAIVARGIYDYLSSLPVVTGGNLTSVGETENSISVLKSVFQYVTNYADESSRRNAETLLHADANRFLQCFTPALMMANGEDSRQSRAIYNAAFSVQQKQSVQGHLDESYTRAVNQAIYGYVSGFGAESVALSLSDVPLIGSETREVIKLVDLPLLALQTRVLSKVFVSVPSTKAEPYKMEQKVKVQKQASFDVDQDDEYETSVIYQADFAGLNSHMEKAHLFTYAYPINFTEDKLSLNETHVRRGVKHEKNSLDDIYEALLSRMVGYCFYTTVNKSGVPERINFSVLLDSCNKTAAFTMGSSDTKKYLSFLDVVLDGSDPKNKLLSGISITSATNFSNGETVPEDFKVRMNQLKLQIESIATQVAQNATYDANNKRIRGAAELTSEAKKWVDGKCEEVKALLKQGNTLAEMYRYFSAVRTQTSRNGESAAREAHNRTQALTLIYQTVQAFNSRAAGSVSRAQGAIGVQSALPKQSSTLVGADDF